MGKQAGGEDAVVRRVRMVVKGGYETGSEGGCGGLLWWWRGKNTATGEVRQNCCGGGVAGLGKHVPGFGMFCIPVHHGQ